MSEARAGCRRRSYHTALAVADLAVAQPVFMGVRQPTGQRSKPLETCGEGRPLVFSLLRVQETIKEMAWTSGAWRETEEEMYHTFLATRNTSSAKGKKRGTRR